MVGTAREERAFAHPTAPRVPRRSSPKQKPREPKLAGLSNSTFCRYVRGQNGAWALADAEIVSRRLAAAAVGDDVERDLLTLVEGGEASALDGADVNEHVLLAVIRLDETITLLGVEPLHGAHSHGNFL